MKLKTIVSILILMSVIIPISSAQSVSGIKSISTLIWDDYTVDSIKSETDKAKAMGLNSITIGFRPNYINTYWNAPTDPLKDTIPYIQSQGISIVYIHDIDNYPANGRETFYLRLADQQKALDDLKWVVNRYPQIMVYELEEPHRYGKDSDTAQAYRTAMNEFFKKVRAIVPTSKALGFNLASLTKSNNLLQGFDVDFVNSNNIFTFYTPQLGKNDINTFKSSYYSIKTEFPNLEIYPSVYVSYSGLQKLSPCTTSLTYPQCWNQAFFAELKWLKSQNIPFNVFRYGWWMDLKSATYFPADTTPGATVKDKIRYILGSSSPLPTPSPTPISSKGTVLIDSIPQGASIKLCGGSYGITPRDETTTPIININPAVCTVELSLSGYKPFSSTITIIGGQDVDKTYTLIPLANPTPTISPTPVPTSPTYSDPFTDLISYLTQLFQYLFATSAT